MKYLLALLWATSVQAQVFCDSNDYSCQRAQQRYELERRLDEFKDEEREQTEYLEELAESQQRRDFDRLVERKKSPLGLREGGYFNDDY